ncbi:MAG: hypothetical protein ACREHD_35010 [Pirellulales bacterium]
MEPVLWDVRDLTGRAAHIEIVDDSTELWGHINIDHIVFTNSAPAESPRRATDRTKNWAYGYSTLEGGENRVAKFTHLPYFNGWWHGSAEWPDPHIDWASLTGAGGHPATHHAVIRRWISPAEGFISIKATLTHKYAGADSDGVRGRIITGGGGVKGEWSVRASGAETNVAAFSVAPAESVDFVVDCLAHTTCDGFDWPVTLELKTKNGELIGAWDSVADFAGPENAAVPADAPAPANGATRTTDTAETDASRSGLPGSADERVTPTAPRDPGQTSTAADPFTDALATKVTLKAPYPARGGGNRGRISVQYAVIEVVQQAGLKYDFNTSFRNTDPACRLWVRPNIRNRTCGQALKAILDPVGLAYKVTDGVVVLERK